jgi:uncharacterized protein (TIGR03435 family)
MAVAMPPVTGTELFSIAQAVAASTVPGRAGQDIAPTAPKVMAADADVSFKKARIKRNTSGGVRPYGFHLDGRAFVTEDTSLTDLISYAYEVHAKQIVGGPDWMDQDRYDIDATLEQKGEPSHQQLRVMVKKLLADRFRLTFHADKVEMPACVLTVGKNGPKLSPTEFEGQLPGISETPGPGGMTIFVRNATLEDFAVYLQLIVLDRPVVDLTGLTGRFDFHVTYTPDAAQFNGHPPKPAAQPAAPAPDLSDAIRQQLGLELEAEKTFVDVVAVDHAEGPRR